MPLNLYLCAWIFFPNYCTKNQPIQVLYAPKLLSSYTHTNTY